MRSEANAPTALDPEDLSARWSRARRGARGPRTPDEAGARGEARALAAVPPDRREAVTEALFRNSWRLGRSAAGSYGPVRGVDAMVTLFAGLDAPPCLAGSWAKEGGIATHRRQGCAANSAGVRFVCDAWREAIDGLVCGLGEGVAYVRRSRASQAGGLCEELLYAADARGHAWGAPPPDLASTLARVAEGLAERGVAVRFLGINENRLGYVVEAAGLPDCGPGGGVVTALIENHLHHRLPGFELAAASPRSVL